MDITLVMPTMDTMDTHMPTTVMPTMERDLLMLSQVLMLMPTTDTMDITLVMPTMDTMDTHMPTTVTTMARDPLMLSQRLMLMPSIDTMDMDITSVMPTMDTTDTHMPTTVMPTTERDLLMLKPMLMLTTDTHTLWILWIWTSPRLCPPWILRIPICPPRLCLLRKAIRLRLRICPPRILRIPIRLRMGKVRC